MNVRITIGYTNICPYITSLLRINMDLEKGHFTDLALAAIINVIHKAWQDKKVVLPVLTDLSKAFDTLDHLTLLNSTNIILWNMRSGT